ncbi:zinc metallopeptidase [Marinomonas posidonica]|uniref:Peptidase membrane zinc metallopeptidase n=1 Tax=Marinomonas posidonica (strain CECT 7376 / NCIMB 14433 / IVIA-Po-181) TaxID=491952 RepID=F6CSQ0_MARPP|nr:zinc metallopeptidase [Marinomonas posidonica]AEF56208.1 peptidase membrane zinc metallopeptidase [Marinomonas posidonica IVIA-Po-181]
MLWVLVGALALGLIFGPNLWVKYTLKRYAKNRADLPGTGGEFANHLVKRFELNEVKVEAAKEGQDHFDFVQHRVRLSPSVLAGRSLTAVAVAAHEVGHAIAHETQQPISRLSSRYLPLAHGIHRLTAGLLVGWPVISAILHLPYAVPLHAAVVGLSGLLAVFVQVAILPEEWDASFKKALPILTQGNYIPQQDLPKVKRILTACAMTYVAAALMRILFVWRWFKR